MIPSRLLALWALVSPVFADEIVGFWTLYSFRRSCSPADGQCQYSFGLTENSDSGDDIDCFLTVKGTPQSDFTSQYCDQRFVVNGGWNVTGDPNETFITVVVTDLEADAYAFFSFRETEFSEFGIIMDSPTRPAYAVGSLGSLGPQGSQEDEDDDDDGDEDVLVVRQDPGDLGKMQISQLRRLWDAESKTIFTSFEISTTQGDSVRCELRITDTEPKDSWYSRGPCDKFTISWGYNDAADSAVMSVCNSANGMVAWFGFDHVSDFSKTFPASRWEPYHQIGCR